MQQLVEEKLLSDLACRSIDKAEQVEKIDIVHRLAIQLVKAIAS